MLFGQRTLSGMAVLAKGVCIILLVPGCVLVPAPRGIRHGNKDRSVLRSAHQEYFFVAHGLGPVPETSASSTKEAFENGYAQGFKLFEVDLSLTKDGKVVVFHAGNEESLGSPIKAIENMTSQEFFRRKFLKKYTLLTLEELLQYAVEHEDIYIITDAKGDQAETLRQIAENPVSRKHPSVLDRIIPQIYTSEELKPVMALYPFRSIIFTLYRTAMSNEDVLRVLRDSPEITAVTMWWDSRYTDEFKTEIEKLGRRVYVHTVNNPLKIREFIAKGVGVYTDDFDVKKFSAR